MVQRTQKNNEQNISVFSASMISIICIFVILKIQFFSRAYQYFKPNVLLCNENEINLRFKRFYKIFRGNSLFDIYYILGSKYASVFFLFRREKNKENVIILTTTDILY